MESRPPDGSGVGDHEDIVDIANGFVTTQVPHTDRDHMPYSTVGKMFMTFDGQDYVGTGWVIAEMAVFTAGHCVLDRSSGRWADNILFIPQFDDEASPVGKWSAGTIFSLRGWTDRRGFEYDMAAYVTDRPIRPKTGSLGWIANSAPNQGAYKSAGFPGQPVSGYDFNGHHMWQSVGGYIEGTNPVRMHNNMTEGCSGGPLVVTRNRNVYANGLNSFRYQNQLGTMFSPYFGDGFLNLYNTVKSGAPTVATS